MHKWKKLVAGVLSASMIIPAAPLTAGATEQIELVQQAEDALKQVIAADTAPADKPVAENGATADTSSATVNS